MRKILLASAAMVGATGLAQAQPAALPISSTQGTVLTTSVASPPAGVNNNNNTSAAMRAGGVANPTPGSVVIRFNGRVHVGAIAAWGSGDKSTNTLGQRFEISPVGIYTYARLYAGVDALTTTGLRYGAGIEIRENFGATSSSVFGTGAGGYGLTNTLYVRRAFAYVANENVGILRVGVTDGVIGLYDGGQTSMQFLPTGNLNGGDLKGVGTVGIATVPFAALGAAGNEYGNAKIVYLSPRFAGFDFGLQYAPSVSVHNGVGSSLVAASTSPNLSSSAFPLDGARITDQAVVGVRYQGTLGGVGILAYGAYQFSSQVSYNGPAIARPTTFAAAASPALSNAGTGQFDNLSFGSVGTTLSFAGFTVGGNVIFGDVNGQTGMKPSGGASQVATVAGVTYRTGPLVVGVVGEVINSQGDARLVGLSQRRESAIDFGAGYTVAPGFVVWGEYVYQQRHQAGFNFATGGIGTAFNDVKSQGVMLGSTFFW